ncbi:MAG: hypothetical protein QG584_2638 [Pseudomonadota bacterium]|nr:hypothetical protein [Pseudomonadota bacterium]
MIPRERTKLERWKRANRYSDTAFASAVEGEIHALIGEDVTISSGTVTKWRLGGPDAPMPRKLALRAIYVITKGEVDPNSFADLPELA